MDNTFNLCRFPLYFYFIGFLCFFSLLTLFALPLLKSWHIRTAAELQEVQFAKIVTGAFTLNVHTPKTGANCTSFGRMNILSDYFTHRTALWIVLVLRCKSDIDF